MIDPIAHMNSLVLSALIASFGKNNPDFSWSFPRWASMRGCQLIGVPNPKPFNLRSRKTFDNVTHHHKKKAGKLLKKMRKNHTKKIINLAILLGDLFVMVKWLPTRGSKGHGLNHLERFPLLSFLTTVFEFFHSQRKSSESPDTKLMQRSHLRLPSLMLGDMATL